MLLSYGQYRLVPVVVCPRCAPKVLAHGSPTATFTALRSASELQGHQPSDLGLGWQQGSGASGSASAGAVEVLSAMAGMQQTCTRQASRPSRIASVARMRAAIGSAHHQPSVLLLSSRPTSTARPGHTRHGYGRADSNGGRHARTAGVMLAKLGRINDYSWKIAQQHTSSTETRPAGAR